jgi:hypothetical protein
MLDSSASSYWESDGVTDQNVFIDFKTRREFGGLKIGWKKDLQAKSFNVLLSDDGNNWEKVYSVLSNKSDVSFIRLPEAEAKFLKINLLQTDSAKSFSIKDIAFLDVKNSLTLNDFFIYVAKNSPAGDYPKYFSEQASYWTIIGVNGDVKEALINEDGIVEIEKGCFSIEPVLKVNDRLSNWAENKTRQSLEGNYLPIPVVDLSFYSDLVEIKSFTSGEANKNSILFLKYTVRSIFSSAKSLSLCLLIRPFQVNPYYQFLNLEGGVGKINSIKEEKGRIYINEEKVILPVTPYNSFGACTFDEGNITYFLREGKKPENKSVIDPTNLAIGVLQYDIYLEPGKEKFILRYLFMRIRIFLLYQDRKRSQLKNALISSFPQQNLFGNRK